MYTVPFFIGQYINHVFSIPFFLSALCLVVWLAQSVFVRIFVLSFCVGALMTSSTGDFFSRQTALEAKVLLLQGVVLDGIRRKRAGGVEIPLRVVRIREHGDWQTLSPPQNVLCTGKDLPWRNESDIFPGSHRSVLVRVWPLAKTSQRGWRDIRDGYTARCKIYTISSHVGGQAPLLYRFRKKLSRELYRVLGESEATNLMQALLLGNRDAVSRLATRAFQRVGLAHILVVSGYHLGVIYAASLLFFYQCSCVLVRAGVILSARRAAGSAALIFVLLFALLCPPHPSLLRALLTFFLLIVSYFWAAPRSMIPAMLFSLVFISAVWPLAFLEPGVHLTYAALIGLYLSGEVFFRRSSPLVVMFAAQLFVSTFTGLVSLFWFGQCSVIGVAMNLMFAPLLTVVGCKLGFFGLFFYFIGFDPHGYILQGAHWCLKNLIAIILRISELPGTSFEL